MSTLALKIIFTEILPVLVQHCETSNFGGNFAIQISKGKKFKTFVAGVVTAVAA